MLHTIAGIALKLAGWATQMQDTPARKCVMLAVPHTSNWDFVFFMLHKWYFRLPRLYWLGKHTLFKGALKSRFFRAMGGLPVDRRQPGALVQELSELGPQFSRRHPGLGRGDDRRLLRRLQAEQRHTHMCIYIYIYITDLCTDLC